MQPTLYALCLRVSAFVVMEGSKEVMHLITCLFFLRGNGLFKDYWGILHIPFFFFKAQQKVTSFVLFPIATPFYKIHILYVYNFQK